MRHFGDYTRDLAWLAPKDIGSAQHGRPRYTGEPKKLSPRQRTFHCDLIWAYLVPYHTRGVGPDVRHGLPRCLEVFRVEVVPLHEVVYHGAGDTYFWRQLRQVVRRVPAGVFDLTGFGGQAATRVIRGKTDHERVRKRPRLAPEVPDVRDLDPDLLPHLADDGLLYGLAGLDEASEQAVEPLRKSGRACQQEPIPFRNQDDGCRAQTRVVHHPAARTPLRELPWRRLRLSAAASAEPVRRMPADDLLRPARHPEEILVHPGKQAPEIPENHPLGWFGVSAYLDGPASVPVEGSDLPTEQDIQTKLLRTTRERHADGRIFAHEQPVPPEREPQHRLPLRQRSLG